VRVAFHAGQLLQPVPGGIGRYERALLERLPACGVDLIAFAAGARPAGVAAHVPWLDLGAPRGGARYELWHRLRLPSVRVDADLLHAPSLAIPPAGRTPLVVTVHDVAFLRVPHSTTRRGVRFHTRGLELARRHAATIVTPSEFTRTELAREGFPPDRLVVARFGVEPPEPMEPEEIDRIVAAAGAQDPYVLTVGTVEPRKDLPTLVAAVERLRARDPRLTLVVAGPRGWGEITGLDRPFVRMLGAQPWRTIDALYRRARVFGLASLYEGFGLPALEAMARGTPTVTTTGSATEEVARDAGLLFAPGDVGECAGLLERALHDEALRADLRVRALARAAELTWDRTAAEHARIYARTLERSRS
jgi:glycosyltransferase involved in cell wall biosynthesis